VTGPAVGRLQFSFIDSWITGGGSLARPLADYFPPATTVLPPDSLPAAATGAHPLMVGKSMQVVADEPDARWGLIRMGYEWILQHAKDYVWMQTPYFVPPASVMSSLCIAALSGVDVRLMLPRKADNLLMRPANRAYLSHCLEAGVRVFLRNGNFMHCKTIVSDDYLSSVGSANMDNRSFSINFEVNTYVYDKEAALQAKGVFEEDMIQCDELSLEKWESRPWYDKATEYIVRLFSPLL